MSFIILLIIMIAVLVVLPAICLLVLSRRPSKLVAAIMKDRDSALKHRANMEKLIKPFLDDLKSEKRYFTLSKRQSPLNGHYRKEVRGVQFNRVRGCRNK